MKLELVELHNKSIPLLSLGCGNRKSLYIVLYTIQHENTLAYLFFKHEIDIMNYVQFAYTV